ncbi:hypothetical protein OAF54_02430 [bacterium]|nr:hypothetical protein [bacterium]
MATINLRVGNDALTFQELDDNFTNLNNDKAELSGCTFTGDVNINSATNTEYLMVSRNGSATAEVLQIGVADTAAVFNYIEDTTNEGTGNYGTYQFKLSGNEGTTPTVNAATLTEDLLTVLGTIRITTPLNLTTETTAVMIDSNNDLGYRELGSLAFSSDSYDNYSSWTLTGDSGSNQTISSGNTMDVAGGTEIATEVGATDTVTVNHSDVSRSDTTSSDSPAYGGTFEAVTSVTSNARGHITAIDVSTVTIPASDERDTNLSWTGGTTAGPSVNSSTGTNAVIPSATGSASGVVTTGTQTFAGSKIFSSTIAAQYLTTTGLGSTSEPNEDDAQFSGYGVFGNRTNPIYLHNGGTGGVAIGAGNATLGSGIVMTVNTGAVNITGTLTATSKSFDIEHPTKEGMRLRYGSLEGPENGVYVRGRTTENVIELPDYWAGLVDHDSITVHVTPIGKSQNIWVKKIEDYKVHLRAVDGVDCFYTIYGERKDTDKLTVEYGA